METFACKCLPQGLNSVIADKVGRAFAESADTPNECDEKVNKPFALFNFVLYRPMQHAAYALRFADGTPKPIRVRIEQARSSELFLYFRMARLATIGQLGVVHETSQGCDDRVSQGRGRGFVLTGRNKLYYRASAVRFTF